VGDAALCVIARFRAGSGPARLLALLFAALSVALAGIDLASAQSVWGGTGSTTTTSDYNAATNWSNPPAGAPPVFPTQSAIFGAGGSPTIVVSGIGPPLIIPDSWTFQANSQSYTISGVEVDFSLAGPTGGLINNANAGQTISISNSINDGIGGAAQVQQLGASTLILSGVNGYNGGTLLSAGIVQVNNANSLGATTAFVTFNGGTLQGDGTSSSIGFTNPIQITGNGGTIDANTDNLNFSGNITDAVAGTKGALTITDSSGFGGVIELSGTNTYSGGTTVSNLATVQVINNSSVGTGTVTLNNGQFQAGATGLAFTNNFAITTLGGALDANGNTLTILGNITDSNGPGSLTIRDSTFTGSTVILDGTNTYTGGTLVCSCGSLQLGDASHVGSLVGAIIVEGSLTVFNADTTGITSIDNQFQTTFLNSTSASTITITNEGQLFFNDSSSAASATMTNSGGEIIFSNSSTAASATIINGTTGFFGAPGELVFLDNSTAGNSVITNNNGSLIAFGQVAGTDTPTAGNATITNKAGGEIDFNAFSTAGNATITTNNNARTLFFDNSTGGNARLIASGTNAIVDFTETIGPNSDGQISAGSIEGSGKFYIGSGNTLTVGSNNLSTIVSGVIADFSCGCGGILPGSLVKIGTGTLTLSGNNTYTGSTTVNGGTLEVDGSIAHTSSVMINAGGTLSGTGLVDPPLATTTIASGGTLAPGNAASPTGTLTIGGNLAFLSGAFYLVQLTPSAAAFTTVGGTANLAGTVQAVLAPGSYSKRSYDILHATGSLAGTTFNGLTLSNPNYGGSLSYTTTDVFLNLTAALGGIGSGLNINQQNVANALNTFFNNGGVLPPGFSTIFGLTGPQLSQALSQLDGEDTTGAQKSAFQLMSDFLNLMLDPSSGGGGFGGGGGSGSGGATGFAPEQDATLPSEIVSAYNAMLTKAPPKPQTFDQRWTAWGSAFGGTSHIDGDPVIGSTNVRVGDFGFAGGMSYHLSPETLFGFAIAGGGTNWSLDQNLGSGRSDAFEAGVYAKTHSGPAYLSAALAFANHWFTTNRTSALGDQLQGKFQGQSYGGRLEAGYRFSVPATNYLIGFTPYAALQAQSFHTVAFTETDLTAGGFGLNFAAMNATDTRSELGMRADDLTMFGAMPLILRGRLAWAHDWVSNPALGAVFQTLPGSNFIVNGAAPPKNSALTTASAELRMTENWSLLGKFDGELGRGAQTYGGTGTLRYSW
jgi:outer membrane autotransporter protein